MEQDQNSGYKLALYQERYKEFPPGKWFVRWVSRHRPPSMNRQTPRMEVLLCQVPPGKDFNSYAPYSDPNPQLKIVELSVAELPDIRLNDGYLDGVHVFSTPCELVSLRVNASAERIKSSLTQVSLFKNQSLKTFGWFCAFEGTMNGEQVKVFIPCWEILRSLYTPSSHFAKSLLGFPGDVAIDKIVDISKSFIDPEYPSEWHFKLRHHTAMDYYLTAGFLTLHAPARAAINHIFMQAIMPNGFIGANLPFDDDQLDIKINFRSPLNVCIVSGVRYIYATELICARWDIFDSLHFHPDKEGGGEDGTAPSAVTMSSPFGPGLTTKPHEDEIIISGDDPDKDVGANIFHRKRGFSALVAENVFRIDVKRKANTQFRPKADPLSDKLSNTTSSSDRGSNDNDVAGSSKDQELNLYVDTFKLLFDAFTRLKQNSLIDSFEVIPPLESKCLRSGFIAWRFPVLRDDNKPDALVMHEPVRIRFGWIDYSQRRQRSFLVIKVRLIVDRQMHEVLWLETETKQGTGVFSVIATGGALDSKRIIGIRDAIVIKDGKLGITKNRQLLGPEHGAVWSWKHDYRYKPNEPDLKLMKEASMLKKIIEGLSGKQPNR